MKSKRASRCGMVPGQALYQPLFSVFIHSWSCKRSGKSRQLLLCLRNVGWSSWICWWLSFIAPSDSAMQSRLNVCESYAQSHNLQSSTKMVRLVEVKMHIYECVLLRTKFAYTIWSDTSSGWAWPSSSSSVSSIT